MKENNRVRVACKVVGPIQTNCYILSCPETRKAVIVDPGGDPDAIEAFVAEGRLEPVEIVCTHGHSDHIASVPDLKERYGIPFALHGDDLRIVKLSVKESPFWGLGKIREPKVERVLAAGDEIVSARSGERSSTRRGTRRAAYRSSSTDSSSPATRSSTARSGGPISRGEISTRSSPRYETSSSSCPTERSSTAGMDRARRSGRRNGRTRSCRRAPKGSRRRE